MPNPNPLTDEAPVQIVITRNPDTGGFNIIIMSAAKTLVRATALSREHALAAVADYMQYLLNP